MVRAITWINGVTALAALYIYWHSTLPPIYTYAQEAEGWAIERCGSREEVRELRFHGNRQLSLECRDGSSETWDRSNGE